MRLRETDGVMLTDASRSEGDVGQTLHRAHVFQHCALTVARIPLCLRSTQLFSSGHF